MSNTPGNSMPVVNGVIDLALKIQKTSEDAIDAIKNFFNREDKQTQEAVIFDYFSKNSVKYTKKEDSTGYDYLNNTAIYSFTDEPLFNTAFKEREFNGFVESNIFSNSISGSHFFCMPVLNVSDSLKKDNKLIQLLGGILYVTSTQNFIDIKNKYNEALASAIEESDWKNNTTFKSELFKTACETLGLLPSSTEANGSGFSNNRTLYTYSFLDVDNPWESNKILFQAASLGLNNTLFTMSHQDLKEYELSTLNIYLQKVILEDIEKYKNNLDYTIADIENLLKVSLKYSAVTTFEDVIKAFTDDETSNNLISKTSEEVSKAKEKLDNVILAKKAIYLDEFETDGGIINPEIYNSANRVYRAYKKFMEDRLKDLSVNNVDFKDLQMGIDLGLLFEDLVINNDGNLSATGTSTNDINTVCSKIEVLISNLTDDIALFKSRYKILSDKLTEKGFEKCDYRTKK